MTLHVRSRVIPNVPFLIMVVIMATLVFPIHVHSIVRVVVVDVTQLVVLDRVQSHQDQARDQDHQVGAVLVPQDVQDVAVLRVLRMVVHLVKVVQENAQTPVTEVVEVLAMDVQDVSLNVKIAADMVAAMVVQRRLGG